MCGIVGVYGSFDVDLSPLLDCLVHRGPDDEGTFVDPDAPFRMGMRRLSIIDLEGGDQPIFNEDGSVVVVFNGEIYNYPSLRERLEAAGHSFSTDSDTEVLVHLWEEYGPRMPEHLNGMFAFSIWDRTEESLFLARDRLGIKPLLYADTDEGFYWASELEPLLRAGVTPRIDERALHDFLSLQYSPWPRSLVAPITKLDPGTSLHVTEAGIEKRRYWQPNTSSGGGTPTGKEIRRLLSASVRRRLRADVPVGAFLSGGLDSASMVALATDHVPELQTFSVAFETDEFDESSEAQFVADHFGTDHHEHRVDISSMDSFETTIGHYGEPLADPAMLPTRLLAEHASDHVKVVLTGEGADELFGGYDYYRRLRRHRRVARFLPSPAFTMAETAANYAPAFDRHLRYTAGLRSDRDAIRTVATQFREPPNRYLSTDCEGTLTEKVDDVVAETAGDVATRQMAFDRRYKLPSRLLAKVDRASMSVSLEARVPFLDHELVERMNGVATSAILDGRYKPLLRRAMADELPERTLHRSKQGFNLPIGRWFRQGADSVDRWFEAGTVEPVPYLNADAVSRLKRRHTAGRTDHAITLWKIMNYVAWYHTVLDPYR